MKFALSLIALSILFVGCKFDLKPTLYLSDVVAADLAPDASVEATIEFDSSSAADKIDFLLSLIKKYFVVTGEPTSGGSEYTKLTIVPITIPLGEAEQEGPDDSVFFFTRTGTDEGIAVDFHVNQARFAQASDELQAAVYSSLDLKEIVMTFSLNNDLREVQTVLSSSVYLDGKPVPFQGTQTLSRRQNLELKPSNVLQDSFGGESPMRLFIVQR